MFSKRSPCWLCLAQWFPGESESPFGAVGHCLCRAWNPIISTAMLALWHQTPLMQNAIWCRLPATRFTVQLLQRCSLMGGLTDRRGKRGWDGLLTTVTLMRDMERGVQGLETAGNENRMWTIMVILNNNYIKILYTKWQVKMRNIYISINTTNALLYYWDIIIKKRKAKLELLMSHYYPATHWSVNKASVVPVATGRHTWLIRKCCLMVPRLCGTLKRTV